MKLALSLSGLFFSVLAWAGGREYSIKGLATEDQIKTVKTKVCSIKGFDTCEVSAGKIKLTSKTENKSQENDIRKALKEAGNFEITGSTDVGNGKPGSN